MLSRIKEVLLEVEGRKLIEKKADVGREGWCADINDDHKSSTDYCV